MTMITLQPTAQFYGKLEQRHITITEGEQANLPLRLTGDGVSTFACLIHSFLFLPSLGV